MLELKGKHGKDCKVFIDNVEDSALATIYSILDDEVSAGVPVRIMPDTHSGMDIVIGFTMPLTDRVNPNHIGVDIGCGVMCVRIPKLNMPLSEIDERIRWTIPMGFAHRTEAYPVSIYPFWDEDAIKALTRKIGQDFGAVARQIGTLGGGNHFIEIGEKQGDNWYLFIHTGSRNFGLQVCKYHAAKAKAKGSKYLFADDMAEYFDDLRIVQQFAKLNRYVINSIIRTVLCDLPDILCVPGAIECDTVHNYIDFKRNIIRKGAVRAEAGERLVIPMNMRDGVLLCVGKGNSDWNYSAPHGAGRVLSRSMAKSQLDMEDFVRQMDGIYSSSVCRETLDESPMTYKNMQTIIDCIGDTVDVEKVIKPILNIKAK